MPAVGWKPAVSGMDWVGEQLAFPVEQWPFGPPLILAFRLAGEEAKQVLATGWHMFFFFWICQISLLKKIPYQTNSPPSFCSQSQHINDEENSHERKPRECEATGPLSSHSVGDIRPNSCATTTTVTMSMTERLTRRADLYSSSEYVRYSAGGNYDENGWCWKLVHF